jgi:hypothetical protein
VLRQSFTFFTCKGGFENNDSNQIGRARMTYLQGECSYRAECSVHGRVLVLIDPPPLPGGTGLIARHAVGAQLEFESIV